MKTIKELEKEIYEAQSCEEANTYAYQEQKALRIVALKDIIKLIDETDKTDLLGYDKTAADIKDELKARITG